MGITVKHRGAADGLTGAERDITGRSYDVTVIGGGILGAMAGWRLSAERRQSEGDFLRPGRSDVRCDLQRSGDTDEAHRLSVRHFS